jgi:tricorn protease
MPSIPRLARGAALAVGLFAAGAASAQVDARLLRHPDVSSTHIAFVYAGDIWIVGKAGGTALRLSSPGGEESFPRFSPDGASIAYSANYHGNVDAYVVPTMGGLPTRLTHHPIEDQVVDWTPDGDAVLFASARSSGRQRFDQLWQVSAEGGMPERLPLAYAEFASFSPDGGRLAFTTKSRLHRTWKRYRGGFAADLWIWDRAANESHPVAVDPANDELPMWHGDTVYFLSDRGAERRFNLWALDLETDAVRQLTRFADDDVHYPALGPGEIVFEAGGRLHLLDLATEQTRPVDVRVVSDRATLQPAVRNAGRLAEWAMPSPSAKRVLVGARGEVFSIPAEHGPVLNLTATSGVAERYPAWSPDGEWLAWFSDASGEYDLVIRPAAGPAEAAKTVALGPGFRYPPTWSPDSRRLAFIDQAQVIWVYDRGADRLSRVDQQRWSTHGALAAFRPAWSPDGRWLAWAQDRDMPFAQGIALYDTREGKVHSVTSGYYGDSAPAFDPEGKYLYYLSSRSLRPVYGDVDTSWVYPNSATLVAVPLRTDVPSPLAPRNDVEGEADEDDEDEEDGEGEGDDESDEEGDAPEKPARAGNAGKATEEAAGDDEAPPPVAIDLDGFEERAAVLPLPGGNYRRLSAAKGKLVVLRGPLAGSAEDAPSTLVLYDLEKREEKTVLADVDDYELAAGGEKLLVVRDDQWAIVDVAPEQKIEPGKTLAVAALETRVDPAAEWRQIFLDAWRFQRDYFYDPNMHGVDWQAVRRQYGALLEDAVTRSDVNFVLGEMIGELDASHTYRGGGEVDQAPGREIGLLGVDWELADGAYRVARIVRGGPWDAEVRSPLDAPGVDVDEGTWVLAANGVPLDPAHEPWAAFDGLAGKPVTLTVNDRPDRRGARDVLVQTLTLDEDLRLRHLAWIEENRRTVAEASGGRVGYVYVPDTGQEGQTELVRQFRAQFGMPGLLIDERFNSGGQIPDRFVELLDRPPVAFWATRDGADWPWPPIAHFGPKAMLINGWSGSGGDAFPAYFKAAGLGPLVGTRTWGGLIGISGNPPLVDGGVVTVPTFRMYGPDGTWFAEGHGVEPDVEVLEDPVAAEQGRDPQLLRGAAAVVEQLDNGAAPRLPARPGYEDRWRGGGR